MNVSFNTSLLKSRCAAIAAAEGWLGVAAARRFTVMLADLESLENGAEAMALFGESFRIGDGDSVSVDFGEDCRARFVAVGARTPRNDAGLPVWNRVTRIKLMGVTMNGADV